jgi:hypothetical protein
LSRLALNHDPYRSEPLVPSLNFIS